MNGRNFILVGQNGAVLNIKDPEAHPLAKGLAELEGVSLTALVVSARELGLTPDSDPIAELYDPQTGLPA